MLSPFSALLTHGSMQAKRMHISMCIKMTLRHYGETGNSFLTLMDRLMSICAEHAISPRIEKAINYAVPGRLHGLPPALPLCL